ncbi:hypothetical protein EG339_08190 [Chryseobacterium bernardetii]|uniref:Uncharacterized protein n=1 Tax=Chryseobacterium bernardetii TaxID=1241978 RepID=A0A3G6T5I1_9FLAO|nr:hypothetical protein EG339_08190 [Chryseobacterium bernardetii]
MLIAYCLLLIAYCLLLIAYCLLLIAYCLLLIAYCLLQNYKIPLAFISRYLLITSIFKFSGSVYTV